MDALHDDLFKNKYFWIVVGILLVIVGVIKIIGYNSVESRCERYVNRLGSSFGTNNKLQQKALEAAIDRKVKDCVKNGGLGM